MSSAAATMKPGTRAGPVWVAVLIAVPALLSLGVVVFSWLHPDAQILKHLLQFVLPRVTVNTLLLVSGVAIMTALIGVSLGWLTAVYDFPGKRFFTWALLLPMAMPGYVIAFVFIGLFEYAGPVQTLLREWFGAAAAIPPIRSRGGVILVMSLALYPYVYLLARNAFLTQGRQSIEVAQSLGLTARQGFLRVALPMARPWIAGGLMLVVMETLADFGTVAVFNYDTFTTAIYASWFSLFSIQSALQLAFFLLLFVLAALLLERRLRGRAAYTTALGAVRPAIALHGPARWGATALATAVLLSGFVLPSAQLVVWTVADLGQGLDEQYPALALRTLGLAVVAALTITAAALALAYAVRNAPTRLTRAAARIATLGYALPGTVLAVGIYSQLSHLNNGINSLVRSVTGTSPELFLQGTLAAMLIALLVRFLAVAHQAIAAAMQRVTMQIDEAARSLGAGSWRLLTQVYGPLVRGGLLTGLVLVFVDVMKEMPITLMTRPFGWETLAVRVFEMTSEGQWQQAALPALTIVAVGLVPVMIITRASSGDLGTR